MEVKVRFISQLQIFSKGLLCFEICKKKKKIVPVFAQELQTFKVIHDTHKKCFPSQLESSHGEQSQPCLSLCARRIFLNKLPWFVQPIVMTNLFGCKLGLQETTPNDNVEKNQ